MKVQHQPWMIFQPEGAAVFYMWNGRFPIICHVDQTEGANGDWYWSGPTTLPLDPEEVKLLNKMARSKRTKTFTVPRKGEQKYVIKERGVFVKEEST